MISCFGNQYSLRTSHERNKIYRFLFYIEIKIFIFLLLKLSSFVNIFFQLYILDNIIIISLETAYINLVSSFYRSFYTLFINDVHEVVFVFISWVFVCIQLYFLRVQYIYLYHFHILQNNVIVFIDLLFVSQSKLVIYYIVYSFINQIDFFYRKYINEAYRQYR